MKSKLKSGMRVQIYGHACVLKANACSAAWPKGSFPYLNGHYGKLLIIENCLIEGIYEYQVTLLAKDLRYGKKMIGSMMCGSTVTLHPMQIKAVKK